MIDFLNTDAGFCLSENIRALRKRMKWSQEELADNVGLNRGNIASYENATAEPKICNLLKFAHLFNVSVFDLTHASLKEEEAYLQAVNRHQNGSNFSAIQAMGHFIKEAEDFQQAIKGLHCLFRLKMKSAGDLPDDMQFMADQFEQLHGVTEHLLHSHLDLLALIKEKCMEQNSANGASQNGLQNGH